VWRNHGQEAKRGETGEQRIPWDWEAMGSFSSRVRRRGVPDRERVPARCHASGAAVDVCSDAPAGAQRAERAADGGVVDVACALSVPPRAPRIHAQRVARCDPYHVHNCLLPKNYVERYSKYTWWTGVWVRSTKPAEEPVSCEQIHTLLLAQMPGKRASLGGLAPCWPPAHARAIR
jgi:hypothetical protein